METYKINLSKEHSRLLSELQNLNFEHKIIREIGTGFLAQTEVEIKCDADTLFWIGFFLERKREYEQKRCYDLRDGNDITITVPDAFLLVCKAFSVFPDSVLTLFAGDLCQHPFTSNGSDEREMAMDYFLRGASALDEEGKEHNAEEIFYQLKALRGAWKGNNHQEEFKQRYREALQEMESEISSKKKGGKK